MKRSITLLVVSCLLVGIAISCAGESAETQALFTDANDMWGKIKSAFSLPEGDDRKEKMFEIIEEEWDLKILDNLRKYIKESPKGKYFDEAKQLLEETSNHKFITSIAQIRPFLSNPDIKAQMDSLKKATSLVPSDS